MIKKIKNILKKIDDWFEEAYKDCPPEQFFDDLFGFNRNI